MLVFLCLDSHNLKINLKLNGVADAALHTSSRAAAVSTKRDDLFCLSAKLALKKHHLPRPLSTQTPLQDHPTDESSNYTISLTPCAAKGLSPLGFTKKNATSGISPWSNPRAFLGSHRTVRFSRVTPVPAASLRPKICPMKRPASTSKWLIWAETTAPALYLILTCNAWAQVRREVTGTSSSRISF